MKTQGISLGGLDSPIKTNIVEDPAPGGKATRRARSGDRRFKHPSRDAPLPPGVEGVERGEGSNISHAKADAACPWPASRSSCRRLRSTAPSFSPKVIPREDHC